MKKLTTLFVFAISFFLFTSVTLAETPVVTSFTVPATLQSGQPANISWTIEGGGHSLIVFCTQGIKLRYAATNAVFPCDTKVSVSPSSSDGVSIIMANVSGSPRIVTVRIIPKDANGGADYEAGALEASIYIDPSNIPVSGFYTNATTTTSGVETTFSWSSTYLDGVNFKLSCNTSITATSSLSSTSEVPCNSFISQSDLPGTGSMKFLFNNKSDADIPLTLTLYPAMSPGVYDGTHQVTLNVTVASDAQKPVSVTSFTSSRQKIYSGDSVSFNWDLKNASGANLRFSCTPSLTYQQYQLSGTASSTTSLICNDYAFASPFGPTSSTSISFFNSSEYSQFATVIVYPMQKDGTYNGQSTAILSITVEPTSHFSSTPTAVAQPLTVTSESVSEEVVALPPGTPLLVGCASTYGYSISSGIPCSEGMYTSKIYDAPSAALASTTYPLPGCADIYGFSIFTGQPCSSRATEAPISSFGQGVFLGGWNGWGTSGYELNTKKIYFDRPLDLGSRGDDVRLLQVFLSRDKSIYPEGYVTGYYGAVTARAVGRFQMKYKLVQSIDEPAYGFVGPATRTLLNSLQQ
ncbi:MAG: peptidoglycan-binding protein [Candidatus Taylorbacteria bacterium]|nr:peptidoglycan-binding protein [Candidatus Taylorbacteria bacterium]